MLEKNINRRLCSILVVIIMISSGILIIRPFNPKIFTVEAVSIWIQNSESDFYYGTLNNVTIIGSGEDAELQLKITTANIWSEVTPINNPAKRSFHELATIWGTDKVLLFGGWNSSFHTMNDTWVYDLSDNKWIDMRPISAPPVRCKHAMASIYGTEKVLLMGGDPHVGPSSPYSDTWVYDLSDNTWTNMNPAVSPGQICQHKMATVYGDDKIVLFGGWGHENETWIYDISQNNWSKKNPIINPVRRIAHSMAMIYGTDKVLIYGGSGGDSGLDDLNDTWIYDVSENNWTQMAYCPPGRGQHDIATIYGTDKVVLFGGINHSFGLVNNDTWVYDFSENSWTQVFPANRPEERCSHAMASVWGTDKAVLFSGAGVYRDDTWVFELADYVDNGNFVSQPFEFGPNSSMKKIYWEDNNTSNTSIRLQLRTADTELGLNTKEFVGYDGNSSTYYTVPLTDIWFGHNGDKWVQYKVYFHTDNTDYETPRLKNVTISYNYWPETTLISPTNGSIIVNNKPIFKWNFTDRDSVNQTFFQLLIDYDREFKSIDYNSGEQTTSDHSWQLPNGTSYNEIADGIWYWKVRTKDDDGDWGLFSQPWKITIDSKKPSSIITVPINNNFYNKLDTISGTAFDPKQGTGINRIEITIKRLSDDSYWNGSNWVSSECWLLATGITIWWYDSSSIPWLSGNRYSVQSRATDNATNVEIPNIRNIFTYDDENVVFSDAKPFPDYKSLIEAVEVGITILDNTSGVNASTIEYAISGDMGNTWRPWVTVIGFEDSKSINVSLNLTFPNGTGNRIKWRASDLAGNGPTESTTYKVIVNTWLETHMPKVRLLIPNNRSIVPSVSVRLSWMLENKNLVGVTYDVYFDTVNPPNTTRAMGIMNTNFLIDNLTDGEIYYWTVVPRIGEDVGWCVSGVWSFTVNTSVPFPTVTLTHPKNGSIIPTLLPTLVWSVDYEGTEIVTFDIYLGSNKDPGIEATSYQKTYYLPETDLEDNMTYYWKVIPVAGDIQGPESETWSFTIKRDYIPRFGLNLTLEPSVVELKAAEMTYVKAIAKNLGELNDTISLSIQIPKDANVGAIVNEPVTVNAVPQGIAVFNLTIITPHDIKKGEINLIVVAVSEIAPDYGLSVEENAILKIIILGADKPGTDKSSSQIWVILVILVLIIIGIIVVALFINRKKRFKLEPPPAETITVKPIGAPTLDELKGESTPKPTLAQPPQGSTTTTPQLASPKTVGQPPAQHQIQLVEQKPQLPPVQSQTTIPEAEKTTPTPTLATPQPTLATPKQTEPSTVTPNQIQAGEKDEKLGKR